MRNTQVINVAIDTGVYRAAKQAAEQAGMLFNRWIERAMRQAVTPRTGSDPGFVASDWLVPQTEPSLVPFEQMEFDSPPEARQPPIKRAKGPSNSEKIRQLKERNNA
jgi:hypothetical protein